MVEQKKMTIAELEALLNSETDVTLRILPNGEIVQEDGSPSKRPPLTMRENLAGQY